MTSHIYVRANAFTRPGRPHVLLREFELYLEVFGEYLAVLGRAVEARSRAHDRRHWRASRGASREPYA